MRAFIVAAAIVAITAGTSQATPGQCQRTIMKESRTYTQKVMQIRRQCEDVGVFLGTYQDCSEDDVYMGLRLGKYKSKLQRHVAAACRDVAPADIGWGSCPGLEGNCGGAITNPGGIVDCLFCVNEKAESQTLSLYYDALHRTMNDTRLRVCQKAIGQFGASFFIDKVGALSRCELRDLSGDLPGPCPDPKTQEKIDELTSFVRAKIRGQCERFTDYTPSDIGFVASCPDVTIPGNPTSCAAPITTLDDLTSCVACVTEFKVDCLDALTVPTLVAYPTECQ